MKLTPNFINWRAVILHREDSNIERLVRQLTLLGLQASAQWQPLAGENLPDLVLVDADQGWDGLLPWGRGEPAPCPLVALLASEAPSRIAWALSHGAGAVITKPINTSAVFPALVMALALHEERAAARGRTEHYEERLRLRPLVHAAIRQLSLQRRVDDDEAYAMLRSNAMHLRQPIEAVAADYLAGTNTLAGAG
jgi:AmiR/NasT family two-component response regulator